MTMSGGLTKTLLATGLVGLGYYAYKRWWRDDIAESRAEKLIAQVNDEELEHTSLKECQATAINAARKQLGSLKDTPANRLVVSDVVRKTMTDDLKMRPTAVSLYFPEAVEVYFVPTDGDIMAARIRKTFAVKRRMRRVNTGSHWT